MSEYSEEEKSPHRQNQEQENDMDFTDQRELEHLESQNDEFHMPDNYRSASPNIQMSPTNRSSIGTSGGGVTELMNQRTFSERSLQSLSSTKFTQMVEELVNQYKIPHFGTLMTFNNKFEVVSPTLINNKYVSYQIRGEDALGQFEG